MKASYHFRPPIWAYIAIALIALVLMTIGTAARAQGVPPCLSFTSVVETLGRKHHEEPVAVGMVNEGAVVVLFATAGGETWTMVVRKASGETCFLASGTGWVERLPIPAGKEG